MDLLDFILTMRNQRRQGQQFNILNQILTQEMAKQTQGVPGIPAQPETEAFPGSQLFGGMTFPSTPEISGISAVTREDALREVLKKFETDPRLSLEGKVAGFDLLGKLGGEGEKGVKLGPEDVLMGERTGREIGRGISKTKESKRHILKDGERLVDDEGNIIVEGPEKKEKPKLITVSPGQKVIDESGKTVFEMPKKETEAPKTREYKKNGELVTEEWDAQMEKWKPVAKAPREIEKPSELSGEKQKRINTYKDAITQTMKKYGKPGEFTISSEGISFGEGQAAYDTLVEKAKTDHVAKRDLERVNHWIEEISKEAGLPKTRPNRKPLPAFEGK